MSSFPTSVHFDVPIVDGDAMGRAYPTMYHGKSLYCSYHCAIADLRLSHIQRVRAFFGAMRPHRRETECFRRHGMINQLAIPEEARMLTTQVEHRYSSTTRDNAANSGYRTWSGLCGVFNPNARLGHQGIWYSQHTVSGLVPGPCGTSGQAEEGKLY